MKIILSVTFALLILFSPGLSLADPVLNSPYIHKVVLTKTAGQPLSATVYYTAPATANTSYRIHLNGTLPDGTKKTGLVAVSSLPTGTFLTQTIKPSEAALFGAIPKEITFNLITFVNNVKKDVPSTLSATIPAEKPTFNLSVTNPTAAPDKVELPQPKAPAPANQINLGYEELFNSLPQSKLETNSIGSFVPAFFLAVNTIMGALALAGLIMSGIMYMTAGSDIEKVGKARRNVIWIITGIIIYTLGFTLLPAFRFLIEDALHRVDQNSNPPQTTGQTQTQSQTNPQPAGRP